MVCPNCLEPRVETNEDRKSAATEQYSSSSFLPSSPSTCAGFPLHPPDGREADIPRGWSQRHHAGDGVGDGVGRGVRGGIEPGSGEVGGRGPVPPTPCLVSWTPGCAVAGEGGGPPSPMWWVAFPALMTDVEITWLPRAKRRMMVGLDWFELKTSPGVVAAGCYMQLPSISLLATRGWMFPPKLSMKSIVIHHRYLIHP